MSSGESAPRIEGIRKLSKHGFQPEGGVIRDVFEKDLFVTPFTDDTGDLGPEVLEVVSTTAFASCAEELAWISGEDDVRRYAWELTMPSTRTFRL